MKLTDKEVYDKLKDVIEPYLDDEVDIQSLRLDSHLTNELNINSAHFIDIVLDIENEFDIDEIEDESIMKMETIQNVLDVIKEKTAQKSS